MNENIDIIVIEDDEGLNKLIKISLESQGYRVETAFTGSAGLELVLKHPGSILLLDYMLPDSNALEFIQKLEKRNIQIPFIIMTGLGDEKIAVEIMKHGARDYVIKSIYIIDILPGIIKQVIQQVNTEKNLLYAENLIKSSEEKFRNFFENAPEYCYMISPDGMVLDINRAALKALGYEKDEIIGENIMKIYHPECHKKAKEVLNAFLKIGIVDNEELSIITKKGDRLIILLSASSVKTRHNEILYSLSVQRDVTLRKKAERELVEKEKYYRSILHKINEDIVVINREYIITDINNTVMKTSGLERDEIIGRRCYEIMAGSDKPCGEMGEKCRLLEVFHGREPKACQRALKRKDGTIFHADFLFSPLIDNDGNVTHVIKSIRDISDIMEAQDKISASLKEKESLLKEVHHRVKNNLQIISSMLGLQKAFIIDKKDADIFTDCQNRIRSMARLHEHLYHTNDFSKIEFSKFIEVIIGDLQQTYAIDSSKLDISIDSGSITLDINKAMPLFQILTELLSNSMKYAFADGRRGEIHIQLRNDPEDLYTLLYSDNGPGFPEGFQFPGKESLGLSLVETHVKQIKGKIEINQDRGLKYAITFSAK